MTDGAPAPGGGELSALTTALALKDETRTGWALRGVCDPESVAAHTWGVALLCLLYGDEAGVDVGRALGLAVVHDLAEAETGDVAVRAEAGAQRVPDEEKVARERATIRDLADDLGDASLVDLWAEYEARETPEARFVKDMDLVDMCLQAVVYEREGRYDPGADNEHFEEYEHLDEFFATAEPRLRTDVGRALFAAAREAYEDAKAARADGE